MWDANASPITTTTIKDASKNNCSKDPVMINTRLMADEISNVTTGVPPWLTFVPCLIKKPSRLNPYNILGGIIMYALRMLINETIASTTTNVAPAGPNTTRAASDATSDELVIAD